MADFIPETVVKIKTNGTFGKIVKCCICGNLKYLFNEVLVEGKIEGLYHVVKPTKLMSLNSLIVPTFPFLFLAIIYAEINKVVVLDKSFVGTHHDIPKQHFLLIYDGKTATLVECNSMYYDKVQRGDTLRTVLVK